MNPERIKTIEVNNRKFQIVKMDARASLKVSKLLAAKVLPMLDTFLPVIQDALGGGGKAVDFQDITANLSDDEWLDNFLAHISLKKIASALDLIDDNDLDKLINYGLSCCYEQLPAGPAQVLNANGGYGVAGIEEDMMFTLRLAIDAIVWSVAGFFEGSRWTSMFKGLGTMFQQDTQTSMNSTVTASFSGQ